jgi:hypothetical protein
MKLLILVRIAWTVSRDCLARMVPEKEGLMARAREGVRPLHEEVMVRYYVLKSHGVIVVGFGL